MDNKESLKKIEKIFDDNYTLIKKDLSDLYNNENKSIFETIKVKLDIMVSSIELLKNMLFISNNNETNNIVNKQQIKNNKFKRLESGSIKIER